MGSLGRVKNIPAARSTRIACPVCERLICVSDTGRLLPHAAVYPEMVKRSPERIVLDPEEAERQIANMVHESEIRWGIR
jgi:hypothetical protein